MERLKREFIELALKYDVLRFGSYILKSGRESPYFFNAGHFSTGEALAMLGKFYAHMIVESKISFDALFGPAYKGIPLVSAVSCALYDEFRLNIPWSFNRKEIKEHGEGGYIIGAPLQGKILLIDDVMTAGTAVRESMKMIHAHGAEPAGIFVMIDRQERGQTEMSAVKEIQDQYQLDVYSFITLTDLIDYLAPIKNYNEHFERLTIYKETYGA